MNEQIAVIGLGNMGEALIKGIIEAGLVTKEGIIGCDISQFRRQTLEQSLGLKTIASNSEAVKSAQIIILSVKPQTMNSVLTELTEVIDSSKILISIAAGISIKAIQQRLSKRVEVIRVMPNTPALVRSGISALCAAEDVRNEAIAKAVSIFESVGQVIRVEERLMDAVTAISGCGPAYIFTLIEALSDAGVELGLSRDIALKLSAYTVEGAAKLLNQTNEHPAILRERVASPAGATIVGLHTLERYSFRAALQDAVLAAANRAKEINPNLT